MWQLTHGIGKYDGFEDSLGLKNRLSFVIFSFYFHPLLSNPFNSKNSLLFLKVAVFAP